LRKLITRAALLLALVTACYFGWRLATGWMLLFLVPHGELLGTYEGVEVRSDGMGSSVRGEYGYEYECVELVNRYYVKVLGHSNMTKTGHADSYFWEANQKGLIAHPNGSSVRPQKHDILVSDGGPEDGSPGHVALIVDVDEAAGIVTIIQQNTVVRADFIFRRDVWIDTLQLRTVDGDWFVDQGPYPIPIAGWSRLPATP